MEALRAFAGSRPVQEVAAALADAESVHGLAVEVDPYLLGAWSYYHYLMRVGLDPGVAEEWLGRVAARVLNESAQFSRWLAWEELLPAGWEAGAAYMPRLEPSWRPPRWEDYVKTRRGGAEGPYRLRFALEPDSDPRKFDWVREAQIHVVGETRPAPALLARTRASHDPVLGGISLGTTNTDATLGGILRGSDGSTFALTCAHAVASGDRVSQAAPVDGGGRVVGTVRHCSTLALDRVRPPCNPALSGSGSNAQDFALVELDEGISSRAAVLGVGGVTSLGHTDSGECVQVAGKETGLQDLWVGGFTVTQRYHVTVFDPKGRGSKMWTVINGLFELKRTSPWATLRRRPVKPGDSGAWVLRNGFDGPEWAGVVVAGDRRTAWALPSQQVLAWAENDEQLNLSL